jgi:hypothetical protein
MAGPVSDLSATVRPFFGSSVRASRGSIGRALPAIAGPPMAQSAIIIESKELASLARIVGSMSYWLTLTAV